MDSWRELADRLLTVFEALGWKISQFSKKEISDLEN